VFLTALFKIMVVPPISLLLLALAGLAVTLRWRRTGWVMSALGLVGLLVLAMPVSGGVLLALLEQDLPRVPSPTAPPQAVVILSAEYRAVDAARRRYEAGPLTLERLIGGAGVARVARLPVLVSGGVMRTGAPSLAEVMARTLAENFNTQVRWQETKSRDTWENAEYSARILKDAGITNIYLVSHAWHLRRAIAAFGHFGITATAIPVRAYPWPEMTLEDFIPTVSGWSSSAWALHEWIGIAWYALR